MIDAPYTQLLRRMLLVEVLVQLSFIGKDCAVLSTPSQVAHPAILGEVDRRGVPIAEWHLYAAPNMLELVCEGAEAIRAALFRLSIDEVSQQAQWRGQRS